MRTFSIKIRSFDDVQDFVALATVQPFAVMVGNDYQEVSAKGFIGMFSLDYTQPLLVTADCSEAEFEQFRLAAGRFLK